MATQRESLLTIIDSLCATNVGEEHFHDLLIVLGEVLGAAQNAPPDGGSDGSIPEGLWRDATTVLVAGRDLYFAVLHVREVVDGEA